MGRKSDRPAQVVRAIQEDRDLNPDELSVKDFLESWWVRWRGQSPAMLLARRLRTSEKVIYYLRQQCHCEPVESPYRYRRIQQGRRSTPEQVDSRARERQRRDALMARAKAGDHYARGVLLREYDLKVYSPAEVRRYIRSGEGSHALRD